MMEWKEGKPQWGGTPLNLHLGDFIVAKVYYDVGGSKHNNAKQVLDIYLPGIKKNFGPYGTQAEAQERAEYIVRYWLHGAGLTIAPATEEPTQEKGND